MGELDGRGGRIKAYTIATEVFGRPADFDPQQDSIVRVEVGRLRRALESYYSGAGSNASVVISIPRGKYRPVFTEVESPPPPKKKQLRWGRLAVVASVALIFVATLSLSPISNATIERSGPVVAVAPFEYSSNKDGQSSITDGLQAEFTSALSEFEWLTVVPLAPDALQRMDGAAAGQRIDLVTRIFVHIADNQLAATAFLIDQKTGAVRWTDRYILDVRPGETPDLRRNLVSKVAATIGSPFGVIAEIERVRLALDKSTSADAFTCKLHAFQYWKALREVDFTDAWRCYKAIPDRRGLSADNLAILAVLEFDPLSTRLSGRSSQDLRADALSFVQDFYKSNDFRMAPRIARYTAALCLGSMETFHRVGRSVAHDYPHNPIGLADYGSKLVLGANEPSEGLPLIERARAISDNLTPIYVTALAVDELRRENPADIPPLRQIAARTDSIHVLALDLALAVARNDMSEARFARDRLAGLGFKDHDAITDFLSGSCWAPEVLDLVNSHLAASFQRLSARVEPL